MEPYYYSHMNKQQQAVYHAMKTGIQSLAPSFPCPRMEGKELTDALFEKEEKAQG